MKVSIRGIQEAQSKNNAIIAALRPSGAFGRAIQYATIEARRYAAMITHVDTGGLRASHRMKVSGMRGVVYIDPNASYKRGNSTKRPSLYGPVEHARGGSHAFYARTEREAGPSIGRAAAAGLVRGL